MNRPAPGCLPACPCSYLLERHGDAFRSFIGEVLAVEEYKVVDSWREGEVGAAGSCNMQVPLALRAASAPGLHMPPPAAAAACTCQV